jgi:hypothetical protein
MGSGPLPAHAGKPPFACVGGILIESFHRVSIKHLHRYLSEFELRFNERKSSDRFEQMVTRTAQTSPLTYRKLIAEPTEA